MKRALGISIFTLAIFALFVTCKDPVSAVLGVNDVYTVTFDKNHSDTTGFTEPNPRAKTVAVPATTVETLPTAPTRTTHNFTGWNTQANGGGTAFTAATPVTADITVYAQWTLKPGPGPDPDAYTIAFNTTGSVTGDSVTASPTSGEAGASITINYTVAGGTRNNRLVFSGTQTAIGEVDEAGTGTKTYTINAADADSTKTITINAAFTHTDKDLDTIAFTNNTVNKTYGDAAFTIAVSSSGEGTGAITYSSSHTDIATVNSTTGAVTIVKVGSTTIAATKEADEDYEGTTASYALHIAQLQLTIGVPTGTTTKTYDGTTTATGITAGALTNKVGSDTVTVAVESAAYNSANVSEANKITVVYSISGADAGNYIKPVDSEITTGVSITKAAGAAVTVPTEAVVTHSHIVVNTVAAPSNGQTVEYGYSTSSTSEPSSWQDEETITGLTGETAYYVFARAKANNNYNAGTAAVSAEITTLKEPDPGAALTGTVTVYQLRHNSVRINPITAPAEQTVEYSVTATSGTPIWQDSPIFTGLLPATEYTASARSKANVDYLAGEAITSAAFTTKAAPTNSVPPSIVDFEDDALNKDYDRGTGGQGSFTAKVVADPATSTEQSLRITSDNWNNGAFIPINLPFALENYQSFTFRYYLNAVMPTSNQGNGFFVYVMSTTAGLDNNQNRLGNTGSTIVSRLLANVTPDYGVAGQWTNMVVDINNSIAAFDSIKILEGNIYLLIGMNSGQDITYYLDDLTFNIKDTFVPSASISPTKATFVKHTETNLSDLYADIDVEMTLWGNSLTGISGGNPAIQSTDYTVSGSTVTLKKEYLDSQVIPTGENSTDVTLTFNFSPGEDSNIVITIAANESALLITKITFTHGVTPNVDYIKTGSGNNVDVIDASVTENNVLQVVKTNTNNSTPMVVFTFNLGNKDLNSFSSFYVDMIATSGDRGYKSIRVQVLNPDTGNYINLIADTQVNLGSGGGSRVQQSFNILDAAKTALTNEDGNREIKIAIAVTNTTAITYEISELRLNPTN